MPKYTFNELQGMAPPAPSGGGVTPLTVADRSKKKRPQRPIVTSEEMGGSSTKQGSLPPDPKMRENIEAAAKARGIPREYLYALIQQESEYNPEAHNAETGAHGLAQYIPKSAKARNLDPSDPIASLAWAAKDLKEQMDAGGLDWAIKHHFAGPNLEGHGPKTRQYLADVKKRIEDIQGILAGEAEGKTVPGNVVAGGSDVPVTGKKRTYTFAELQAMQTPGAKPPVGVAATKPGAPAPAKPRYVVTDEERAQAAKEEEEAKKTPGIFDVIVGTGKEYYDMAGKEGERMWSAVKRRLSSDNKQEVKITQEQIDKATEGMNAADAKKIKKIYEEVYPTSLLRGDPTKTYSATVEVPTAEERAQWDKEAEAAINKDENAKGYYARADHPMRQFLRDNAIINAIEGEYDRPRLDYNRLEEVKAIQRQYDMVRNPTKYTPEQVAAAQAAIDSRQTEEDKGMIGRTKEALGGMATQIAADPTGAAADLQNMTFRDPQLAMIPGGMGFKPVAAMEKTIRGVNAASKAAKTLDRVVDPALTGMGLNTIIAHAQAASEGRELKAEEALSAGVMGAVPGAGFGALGVALSAVSRARAGRAQIKAGNATPEQLRDIIDDVNTEQALRERVVTDPTWLNRLKLSPDIQARINQELNIPPNMTKAERKAYLAAERQKWRELFEGTDLEAAYKSADEGSMDRAREHLRESAAKQQADAAAAAREEAAARKQRLTDEYDAALAAREEARQLGEEEAAHAENDLIDAGKRLDEEEIYQASLTSDVPAIRRAMVKAAKRDAQLERPKWQRNDLHPDILRGIESPGARAAVGALFAGTAYAFSPEDDKVRNAVMAAVFSMGGARAGRRGGMSRRAQAAAMGGGKVPRETSVKVSGPQQRWFSSNEFADMYNQWVKDQGLRNWERPDPYIEDGKLYVRAEDVGKFADFLKWAADEPRGGRKVVQVEGIRHGELGDRLRASSGRVEAGIENPFNVIYKNLIDKKLLKPERTVDEILERDTELVEQAKLGKTDAIRTLFDENFEGLVHQAKKYTKGNEQDARDIVQGAFARVFSDYEGPARIEQYRPDMGFRTWMNTVVANRGKNYMEAAATAKRGGGIEHEPLTKTKVNQYGEDIIEDVTARATDVEEVMTPEESLQDKQRTKALADAIKALPEKHQAVFLMSVVEGKTRVEIAKEMGLPEGTVGTIMARTQDKLAKVIQAFEKAEVPVKRPTARPGDRQSKWDRSIKDDVATYTPIDKGVRLPRNQRGSASTDLVVKGGAVVAASVLAASIANRMNQGIKDKDDRTFGQKKYKSPTLAALGTAALVGTFLFTKGKNTSWQRSKIRSSRTATEMLVQGNLVPISTELFFKAPKIFKRFQEFEMRTRQREVQAANKVAPFVKETSRMPEVGKNVFGSALFTGNNKVVAKLLEALDNPKLTEGYKAVRSVLDSVGDELRALKRIPQEVKFDHYPRMVKDYPGLIKELGTEKAVQIQKAIDAANGEAVRLTGRELGEAAINRIIDQEIWGVGAVESGQHGWAKDRAIQEITPELMKYYHTPEDSLLSYLREAYQDIELTKAFGEHAATEVRKGGLEVLDIKESIPKLVKGMVEEGSVKPQHAEEVADLLRARFEGGEVAEAPWISNIKAIGNAGMLGNFLSAGSNLADIPIQALFVQGVIPTLQAVVRQATGRKLISVDTLGIRNNISAEFNTNMKAQQAVNTWLKIHMFNFLDATGKNTALNAALINARRRANTESGVAKLYERYGEVFGDEFPKLINDLKTGKLNPNAELLSWMELSRAYPISKLEMTANYLNNPNLRTLWWMRSYAIKQMDLVHRDARIQIRKGTPAGIAKGVNTLIYGGIILGMTGASLKYVQHWALTGKPPDDMGWQDIPLNMFRLMGYTERNLKKGWGVSREEAKAQRKAGNKQARAQEPVPVEAIASTVVPPYRLYQDIVVGDPAAAAGYVPFGNKWLAEQMREGEQELRKGDKK